MMVWFRYPVWAEIFQTSFETLVHSTQNSTTFLTIGDCHIFLKSPETARNNTVGDRIFWTNKDKLRRIQNLNTWRNNMLPREQGSNKSTAINSDK